MAFPPPIRLRLGYSSHRPLPGIFRIGPLFTRCMPRAALSGVCYKKQTEIVAGVQNADKSPSFHQVLVSICTRSQNADNTRSQKADKPPNVHQNLSRSVEGLKMQTTSIVAPLARTKRGFSYARTNLGSTTATGSSGRSSIRNQEATTKPANAM